MEIQINIKVLGKDKKRKREPETSHSEYEYKTGNVRKIIKVLSKRVGEIEALSQSAKELLFEGLLFFQFYFFFNFFK